MRAMMRSQCPALPEGILPCILQNQNQAQVPFITPQTQTEKYGREPSRRQGGTRTVGIYMGLQQLPVMYKKKKNPNKENARTTKKVPLITVPCFNATEEVRIPTLASNQLKGMVRSIELRKAALPNPYKKSVSRKSTCKSVKQGGAGRPPELRTIMQTFKQLKLLHQNERSKSKSPASCKSRSNKKYFPKRKSHATLITKPNSEVNLALKLEKTIKQLNMTDFFRDEDSLLPIRSSSDIFRDDDPARVSTPDHEEDIDLNELRLYCSTNLKPEKPSIELSLKTYNSFKENRAALKIQTAWKRYQTRRLVSRYIHIYHLEQTNLPYGQPERQRFQVDSPSAEPREEIVVSSEEFYPEGIEGNKVRHISNLEEEASSSEYEEAVKRIKLEELQKWNEIIKIISLNKSDNPAELERLLEKLTQQSELNKRDLQLKASLMLNHRKRSLKSEEEAERGAAKREHSSSDHSMALEEYDSKKYIQYLDGDIFPPQNERSTHSERASGAKISKRKQELLLEELRVSSLPVKLGEDSLYRCESVRVFCLGHNRQKSKSSSRSSLRKSTSEKILRSARENMGALEQIEESSEINLDLLTKQFLEGSDPSADDFDMVYSEEKLKSKLAELSRMKEEYHNEENRRGEEDRLCLREEERLFLREEEEDSSQLRRSHPSFQLHHNPKPEIMIQDGTPEKLQVEVVQAEIASDSDEGEPEDQGSHNAETIANIVLNTLLMEVLRDIARSEQVAESFKAFSLSLKPKIRKFQGNKKKKGFPTSKAEIELFLEGLVKYLAREEPLIFRNLQVPTGPSALEMLRYMHQSGDEEPEQSESSQDEANVMVIPNRIFDAFWQLKERSIVIEVPQHFDQSNAVIFKHQFELLKSFNKIFYRSLFDTFNECLDCQRNFGQYGRPFPWKRAPAFHHQRSEEDLRAHVEQARRKMVELSTTYCGLIIEKEDMANGINDDYIKQVHEDRLSRMLANDLIEAEDRWVFYDDEETEILVEISNALYTELLIELIEQLYDGL